MRKLKIWMDVHIHFCDVICSVFLCLIAVAAIIAELNEIITVILCFALYFLLSYFTRKFAFSEFKNASNQLLQHADPFPMIEFYKYAMDMKVPAAQLVYMKTNYAYALKHAQGAQAAYDVYFSISEQEIELLDLPNQMRYYGNLSDLCFDLGLYEKEKECYAKIEELYKQIPPKYQPKFNIFSVRHDEDQRFYENGEYEKALASLDAADAGKNLLTIISNKMLRVKYLLKLGRADEAKCELNFVIENGNKLYAVTEAKKLLSEIENK